MERHLPGTALGGPPPASGGGWRRAAQRHLVEEGNRSRNKRGDGPVLATTRRRLGLRNQGRPSPYFLSKNRNIFLYAASNSLALGL